MGYARKEEISNMPASHEARILLPGSHACVP